MDQDDARARGAAGRADAVAVAVLLRGPGDERAVRIGRIDGGQHDDVVAVARGAQPIDGARVRELGARQPVDEVAAADLARVLQRAKDRRQRGEATGQPLGRDRLTADDAVALQQARRARVRRLGGRGWRSQQRGHGRPAPRRHRHQAARGGPQPSRGRQRAQRLKGVVRHQPRPDQIPQRLEDLRRRRCRTGARELREEAGPLSLQRGQQRSVPVEQGGRRILRRRVGLGQQTDVIAAKQGDAAVLPAERAAADPHQLAERAQLVEHGRREVAHARRQDDAFEIGEGQVRALELLDHLAQADSAAA